MEKLNYLQMIIVMQAKIYCPQIQLKWKGENGVESITCLGNSQISYIKPGGLWSILEAHCQIFKPSAVCEWSNWQARWVKVQKDIKNQLY